MDDADRAQELIERRDADALDDHYRRQETVVITSRTHCMDCGAAIPEARRHAVVNCRRCKDCQELLENWSSL